MSASNPWPAYIGYYPLAGGYLNGMNFHSEVSPLPGWRRRWDAWGRSRRWTTLVLVLALSAVLLSVYPEGPASAQTLTISGSIPCVGRLWAPQRGSSAAGTGSDTLVFPVDGKAGERVPLRVSVRTNCAYEISARWLGPPGSTLRLEEGSVTPASGGARVARNALSAAIRRSDVGVDRSAVWVAGPVISRGGNDSTPDNAIWIDLLVTATAESGAVQFKLDLHR